MVLLLITFCFCCCCILLLKQPQLHRAKVNLILSEFVRKKWLKRGSNNKKERRRSKREKSQKNIFFLLKYKKTSKQFLHEIMIICARQCNISHWNIIIQWPFFCLFVFYFWLKRKLPKKKSKLFGCQFWVLATQRLSSLELIVCCCFSLHVKDNTIKKIIQMKEFFALRNRNILLFLFFNSFSSFYSFEKRQHNTLRCACVNQNIK